MPLSFLNPWFWLGALAIAAPLWLHLRRKRESNLQPFSALRFLEDQPEPRRRPMSLRDRVLFALRVLALLLLVGAFAWPYLRGENTVPIKESRVYVLDNTLSHQANEGFTHDRDRLLREFGRAGADLQVAVVELTASPRVLVGFGDDRETARQKLEQLQPSFERGSYLAAFRQANALLANSLGAHKRIILLGDNQANQWNEHVSTPPFLRDVEVELPQRAAETLPNVSLAEPRVQRIFLGDKSLVNFSLKLTHQGPARTARITLRANGQAVFDQTVNLEKQPETLLVQAQWEADPKAWLKGEALVESTPDALPQDNRVFFSLAPVEEGTVALLAQSPYLRLALSPEVMRGQWAARLLDPSKLAEQTDPKQDADVLCLESSFLQSKEARKLLWRYLSNGHGVLLLVNRVTPTIDGALRELGFQADGVVTAKDIRSEQFQFVFANHPIFHPFVSPDYGNLMEVQVSQYARLKAAEATPLIFGENGAALFFQSSRFTGKLFLAAFGLDREHTSWPIHQTFIPFLDLTLQAARAEDPTPTTFEPGEIATIQLPAGAGAKEVVLREEQREVARAAVEQGRAQVRMPDKPGLYSMSRDNSERVEKLFSINPSPKESHLAYVESPEAIKTWRLEHPAAAAKPVLASTVPTVRLAGILQQQWWWWMVLAGLAFLLLEMGVATVKKESA